MFAVLISGNLKNLAVTMQTEKQNLKKDRLDNKQTGLEVTSVLEGPLIPCIKIAMLPQPKILNAS